MATSVLAGITQESTQQELLGNAVLLLAAMLDKMPRMDVADRLMVSHAESNPTVSIAGGQTLGDMTNIGGRSAAHSAYALANAGAMHIYDNIKVT